MNFLQVKYNMLSLRKVQAARFECQMEIVQVHGAPAGLTGAGSTIDSEDLAVSRAVVSSASGKIEAQMLQVQNLVI